MASSSKNKKDDDKIKQISSGYTTAEISDILAKAEPVFKAKENKIPASIPKHKKEYFDRDKRGWNEKQNIKACEPNKYDDYVYFEVNGQPLRIETGFEAERDVEVVKTRLHSGFHGEESAAQNHLYFKGDAGITFEVTALISIYDEYVGDKVGNKINYENRTVFPVLDDWVRTNTVCEIVTFSPIIEKGFYRITKFKPKQVYTDYIKVDITFVQDTYNYERPLATRQGSSKTSNIVQGQGTLHTNEDQLNGGTAPRFTGLALELFNCSELKKLCTCTTKKTSKCVTKYKSCTLVLQKCLRKVGLYFDGRVDGLYCYVTFNAVTQYQQRHKDKLNVSGNMDTKTKELLCEEVQRGGG